MWPSQSNPGQREYQGLVDALACPCFGDLSPCSNRNKALADSIGMEFSDAVKRIEEILRHSIVVDHEHLSRFG